ncbi:MAG: Fe-S protein assembly co-chaperone HscB [Beggiatoa sp. IS2]|nr:MAG: Fe-S protein assembly co-chaperone HscB [Beggiatoa sp. IS2]
MSLTANYFEIFDLPVSFDIDTEGLAQRYRELQRLVHPDNYASAAEHERVWALQRAAQINEAFQTLKNPLARGRYLLQLHNVSTSGITLGGDFLMQHIELREELASIKEKSQPLETLTAFLKHIDQQMQKSLETLSQQFAQEDLRAAAVSLQQLQFFKKLREETLALEEDLT